MIKTGVRAVGMSQYEGAIAFGYTDKQAFNYIIFPQAVTHFINSYDCTMRQKQFFSVLNDELLFPVFFKSKEKGLQVNC